MKAEPIIRVTDMAWIRLQAPDLDRQEEFLTNFGMLLSERTPDALYMRGTDSDHHIHITEKGEPRVNSIAFWVSSEEDLHKLAREAEQASDVESINEPGGGKRVRLRDPSGMLIEVVHGLETVNEIAVKPNVLNFGHDKNARTGELLRVKQSPSKIKRIGHAVVNTPDVNISADWAHRHLGLVRSDDVHAEDNADEIVGSFNRIDGGDKYVDHHVLLYMRNTPGLNHVAFEVHDMDDLAVGHEFMMKSYPDLHIWGIGRHTLGSQIFDYWQDPWGRIHEHWTDSDMLNKDHPYERHPRSSGFKSQWGSQSPEVFRKSSSPIASSLANSIGRKDA